MLASSCAEAFDAPARTAWPSGPRAVDSERGGKMAINWIAVLVVAVSTFVLGGLWYGPLFGKVWMSASGMTEERAAQGNMPKIFGISFLLQLLAAAVLAAFLGTEEVMPFGPAVAAADPKPAAAEALQLRSAATGSDETEAATPVKASTQKPAPRPLPRRR